MTVRHTTTDVPYTADQMFALVRDVEHYPDFLPWCKALRVVSSEDTSHGRALTADMVVAYRVFRERFRSLVLVNQDAKTIDVEYLDGPFRHLITNWRFEDKPGGGSIVEFFIEFEFTSFILQATAITVFEKAFSHMSEAFVERANQVYGI